MISTVNPSLGKFSCILDLERHFDITVSMNMHAMSLDIS
jgi:hypothetical protein